MNLTAASLNFTKISHVHHYCLTYTWQNFQATSHALFLYFTVTSLISSKFPQFKPNSSILWRLWRCYEVQVKMRWSSCEVVVKCSEVTILKAVVKCKWNCCEVYWSKHEVQVKCMWCCFESSAKCKWGSSEVHEIAVKFSEAALKYAWKAGDVAVK